MAQLIHLRQRIKAIETIKKITHAMRLISMSTHAQLKHRAPHLYYYTKTMNSLFAQIYALHKNKSEQPVQSQQDRSLVIFIGSQKGLCGNFNVHITHYLFEHLKNTSADLVVIGKKVLEYAEKQTQHSIIKIYTTLSARTLMEITKELTEFILDHRADYARITLASNEPKTFFVQHPRLHTIFPLPKIEGDQHILDDYVWEQDMDELFNTLLRQYVESEVYYALFQSLIAEQASRFISMDASTRNAKKLLEATRLQYNKLRQATITKELTELSSSF
jgi:F-type H+-transporting ATPase subunit gamma